LGFDKKTAVGVVMGAAVTPQEETKEEYSLARLSSYDLESSICNFIEPSWHASHGLAVPFVVPFDVRR
jgi:hypothetical protein